MKDDKDKSEKSLGYKTGGDDGVGMTKSSKLGKDEPLTSKKNVYPDKYVKTNATHE